MMKLAVVSPFPPNITGIGQYGFHVSRSLVQSGQFSHISVVAGAQTSLSRQIVSPSFSIDYAWHPNELRAISDILSSLHRYKPDLIWYNLGASVFGRSPLLNLMGFLSLSLIKYARVPFIVTLHELVELVDLEILRAPGGKLAKVGASLLTSMATQTDVVCLTMRRYVDWFADQRPGVACMHIPIGAYRTPELLPEPETPELLFFTTLAPYKGLEILLAAYCRLLPRYSNLRLTIAGTEHPRFPGYGELLRNAFGGLPGVNWVGQVPEEQVPSLFSQAQLVVLPYIASTGSSSVMYQAAMWGRAMVASDLLETRSVADESGLSVEFFKNQNIDALTNAIEKLIHAPALRKAQIDQNFAAIQATRPEETARLYIQAFNQALAAHNKPERIALPAFAPAETS